MRAAGTTIDWLASVALFIVVLLAAGFVAGWEAFDEAAFAAFAIALLVLVVVVVPTIVEFATRGRSLGKLALGLRVVREDGGAIGLRHALIRALTGVLEIWMTFGGLAALIGLLDPKGRRLGDLLAGTYSQVERVPRVARPVWAVPAELEPWAQVADVATLPDALARRISAFLTNAERMTPDSRERLALSLADAAANHVSPVPEVSAELFIAGVAALRRDREAAALRLEAERLGRLEPLLSSTPHGFPER